MYLELGERVSLWNSLEVSLMSSLRNSLRRRLRSSLVSISERSL